MSNYDCSLRSEARMSGRERGLVMLMIFRAWFEGVISALIALSVSPR